MIQSLFQCCLPLTKFGFLQPDEEIVKVTAGVFNVPTLAQFTPQMKVAIFVSKLPLITPKEFLDYEYAETEGIDLIQLEIDVIASEHRVHSDLLVRRFLQRQPHCKEYLPAIQYTALALIGKISFDIPYQLKEYSALLTQLMQKDMPTKITRLTRKELAKEAKKLSVTPKQLADMELEFLKGLNWNLSLTQDLKL